MKKQALKINVFAALLGLMSLMLTQSPEGNAKGSPAPMFQDTTLHRSNNHITGPTGSAPTSTPGYTGPAGYPTNIPGNQNAPGNTGMPNYPNSNNNMPGAPGTPGGTGVPGNTGAPGTNTPNQPFPNSTSPTPGRPGPTGSK